MERKNKNKKFWEKEYKNKKKGIFTLSVEPSEDLEKFTRWLERNFGRKFLNPLASVLDIGCGNGRNLVFLAKNFGIRGVGFDISSEAIPHAKNLSAGLPISYEVKNILKSIPLVVDKSQTIVLDMMVSHYLKEKEREYLISEIHRVLKPDGWFFWKTFLLDEDKHAERLLRENPAGESGTYIHPIIGLPEHVFTEKEIEKALEGKFFIHKIHKSYRHTEGKRRSISVYAQKI